MSAHAFAACVTRFAKVHPGVNLVDETGAVWTPFDLAASLRSNSEFLEYPADAGYRIGQYPDGRKTIEQVLNTFNTVTTLCVETTAEPTN